MRRTHRWPPLRRGRRHHGGFAMKLCLDAEPPMRGDSSRRVSAAHTEPSLEAAVAHCGSHRAVQAAFVFTSDDVAPIIANLAVHGAMATTLFSHHPRIYRHVFEDICLRLLCDCVTPHFFLGCNLHCRDGVAHHLSGKCSFFRDPLRPHHSLILMCILSFTFLQCPCPCLTLPFFLPPFIPSCSSVLRRVLSCVPCVFGVTFVLFS